MSAIHVISQPTLALEFMPVLIGDGVWMCWIGRILTICGHVAESEETVAFFLFLGGG